LQTAIQNDHPVMTPILREHATVIIQSHPLRKINSEYQVLQHLKKYCGMVSPVEIVIGHGFVEKTGPGNEDVVEEEVMAMIVPFQDSLASFLANNELRQCALTQPTPSTDGKIRNVVDGSLWKNHDVFRSYPDALIFQIYQDDIEVVNPLGSRTGVHKLTMIYWLCLNLPEHWRSDLRAISLLACAKSNHIKRFGFAPVLADFVDVINKLQSPEGLVLRINGDQVNLHGALISVNGDGLALNGMGGFKEGIGGAKLPCRVCPMTREEMSLCF
jgi:hypothetical protein